MPQQQRTISVTGLGYVGLTIANAFAHHNDRVIGYDISGRRISELKKGLDRNGEISKKELLEINIKYTNNPRDMRAANFHIIAVPTPLDGNRHPDLSMLLEASKIVGEQLKKGDIVVYESSVFPGATEEKCIPVLEQSSKLVCGKDFGVGYSPERVNPADKEHIFTNIPKIVSAINQSTLNIIARVYQSVVKAGVYRVSSIRVAEAAKVVENTQRDVNISFINEIALILHSIGMNSSEVLEAMRTKWNALPFHPGLVGGHCIGINSYYLAHKAEEAGIHPDVILAGRRVNEYMPKFIADSAVKELIHAGITIKNARIAVLGLTYKENCPDIHDSRVIDLIRELQSYELDVIVNDPIVDPATAKKEFGINLQSMEKLRDMDAVIVMVAHKEYTNLKPDQIKKMLKRPGLLMDINSIYKPADYIDSEITLWRL